MKKELIAYFQNRRHVALLVLGVLAVAGVLVLIFPPYCAYDIVSDYYKWLQWGVIALTAGIIGLLAHEVSELQGKVQQLSTPETNTTIDSPEKYNFYDERGELKLSVRADALYYMESADNYVQIYYMNAGKLQGEMVRNTLKNIEWRFRGKDLMRCHRSYIVNFSKVQLLRRQDNNELLLDFGDERLPNIPVSKAYNEKVLERFASLN